MAFKMRLIIRPAESGAKIAFQIPRCDTGVAILSNNDFLITIGLSRREIFAAQTLAHALFRGEDVALARKQALWRGQTHIPKLPPRGIFCGI